MKKTILLINLGTPTSCHPKSIKSYLKEFLNDPRVIDLPFYMRWPLVNMVIVPFRYKWTTHAYQKIWTEEGSPLFSTTDAQKKLLADHLGEDFSVEIAMRYGGPQIEKVLNKISKTSEVIVVPLFPQYSSAATGSVVQKVMHSLHKREHFPRLKIVPEFYQHPSFIKAYSALLQETLQGKAYDKLIFSYHGLPERHINKVCEATCDKINACPIIHDQNHTCYRAQCMTTSRLLAQSLNLAPDQYIVSFQSRLGKLTWTRPYTELLLNELIEQGVKSIAISSPSFVSDCLETLEEINIRLREQWQKLGGKEFIFVPSLNTHPLWIEALADIALEK